MTIALVILAVLVGGGLTYGWQQQRITQLEEEVTDLTLTVTNAMVERDTQRLRAVAALDTLQEMRARRSEAGVKAWQTRRGGALSIANGVVDGVAYNGGSDAVA